MNPDIKERLDSFGTVEQLRTFMQRAPNETPIRCQVVGQEGGAWNMYVGAYMLNGVMYLRVYHDELKRLPTLDDEPKRQWYKLKEYDTVLARDMRWYVESISAGGVHLKTRMGGDTFISLPTFMKLYEEA